MDWSAVFEDEGQEEGDWSHLDEQSSVRTGILQNLKLQGQYGPWICYAFTVNYILGVGCLGIPYAFLRCGIVLGSVLVVFMSYISYMTVMWVAVASQQEMQLNKYLTSSNPFLLSPRLGMERKLKDTTSKESDATGSINKTSSTLGMSRNTSKAVALVGAKSKTSMMSLETGGAGYRSTAGEPDTEDTESTPINASNAYNLYDSLREWYGGSAVGDIQRSGGSESQSALLQRQRTILEERKLRLKHSKRQKRSNGGAGDELITELEVTDLAYEFLGIYGKLVYQSTLMMLTYIGLLAYTQVFNSSFLTQFWPDADPIVPALIFGGIVVPLSCCDLSQQISVQVTMSVLRFVSLGILFFGTLVGMIIDPLGGQIDSKTQYHETNTVVLPNPPLVLWSGFGLMFSTAIFSHLFQHSVPGLIRPLSIEHKKMVPLIFRSALMTTSLIYILTGCCCVYYFGNHLQQSVNLNFVGYNWGLFPPHSLSPDTENGDTALTVRSHARLSYILVTALAMVVVLFPALDTLSVFPLIANTLGNNLNSAFPFLHHWIRDSGLVKENSSLRRTTLTAWRLIAAIPPVLASVYISDLIFSLQVAGICGIVVALVTPALLQRQCRFRYSLVPASFRTETILNEFDGAYHSNIVLLAAIIALVISITQMIIQG